MKTARWWDNSIWSCTRYSFSASHRREGWALHSTCQLALAASRPGSLRARAGREEVCFQLPVIPLSSWVAVAEAASEDPALRKALLAGGLPPQIRRHLYQNQIVLEWDELPPGQCSCGAWPCAHGCAAVYRVCQVAHEAPQSLLPLYGCDLDVFREVLEESVSAQSAWGAGFWRSAHPLPPLPPLDLPAAPARLGPLGVQLRGTDLTEYLAPIYDRLGEDEA